MGYIKSVPINYNDPAPYLINELRETRRQLIEQIEVLSQRIMVIERLFQSEPPADRDGK